MLRIITLRYTCKNCFRRPSSHRVSLDFKSERNISGRSHHRPQSTDRRSSRPIDYLPQRWASHDRRPQIVPDQSEMTSVKDRKQTKNPTFDEILLALCEIARPITDAFFALFGHQLYVGVFHLIEGICVQTRIQAVISVSAEVYIRVGESLRGTDSTTKT